MEQGRGQAGDLERIPVPALELDAGGHVVAANRLAAAALGRSVGRLVGAREDELPPPPSSSEELPPADLALAGGHRLRLYSQGGLSADFQERVYHLSRLSTVGQLVTTVVHEINNALSGIVGYSQLLLESVEGEDPQRDLRRILEEAVRTSQVAQNLLRFGRARERRDAPVDLRELLTRCLEMKQRSLRLANVRAECRLPRTLPRIHGDESLLFQVFVNLITNAEWALRERGGEGRIEIRAGKARTEALGGRPG